MLIYFKLYYKTIVTKSMILARKYRLIKAPHHGTSNYTWPISNGLLQDDGIILISWGPYNARKNWAPIYQEQGHIFATNIPDDFCGGAVHCGDVIEINIEHSIKN